MNRTLFLAGFFLVSAALARAGEPAAIGYLEPYRIVTVSAAETGILKEMSVKEGETVHKGQVLARLEAGVFEAELEIARAEAKLQATRKRRLEELASRATPDELEKARTDSAVKDAEVRKAEAQIEARTLRSPVDGVVTEIKRDPSEAVSASQPHVLTVVEIAQLIANLYLPPARAATLRQGATADLILLDEANARVTGSVEFLSPVTDAASGTVRIKFVIDNRDGHHRAGGRCSLAE